MSDSGVMFDTIFGWSTVFLTVLLFVILMVYLKSILAFKHAEVIKGKVTDLIDIGELDLPTIEYQLNGETLHFRSKTDIKTLKVGQELNLQIGAGNQPRIVDKHSSNKLPMVIYVIFTLMVLFGIKGATFLQSLFA